MKWWAIYTNLSVNAIVRLPLPWSGYSQGQETSLAPSPDKETHKFHTRVPKPLCVWTLRSKGLNCRKMKWWAIYAVSGILPRGDRFSKKAKDVNDCLEIKCKDHNIDFISHKNINTRSHLNQDRLHPNRKGQYMMGNNFSTFINNFYFWKLIPTTSTGMSEDCISKSQNSNEIRNEVKTVKIMTQATLRLS